MFGIFDFCIILFHWSLYIYNGILICIIRLGFLIRPGKLCSIILNYRQFMPEEGMQSNKMRFFFKFKFYFSQK